MKRPHRNRARIGGLLLAALGALAILALPGIAAAHDHGNDQAKDAGTIGSFDPATGVLAIDLTGGGTIGGLVVERTKIRCGEGPRRPDRRHRGRHRGHGDWSGALASHGNKGHSGPGSGPPGQGPDGNDDPPGHDGTAPGASEGPGRGDEHSANCTTAALVVGAMVKKAELELQNGVATFEKVELAK